MIKYILDGQECNPRNRNEINYVFEFTERRVRELEMSVDTLEFVAEDYDRIKAWISTYSEYVGMPLRLQYSSGVNVDYLLDFTDNATKRLDRAIMVKIKRFKSWDNFFDNANGLSFSQIQWSESDFRYIDYVIIPEYQTSYYISLGLATYSLLRELAQAVVHISESVTDLIKALTTVGGVPGPDYGAIIILAIKILTRIAYAILVTIALIKVLTEILNILFPVIRQMKCVSFLTLIRKGCQHLGFNLNSTLLHSLAPLTLIPVPLRNKNATYFESLFMPNSLALTNGYPTARDTVRTLGEVIGAIEEMYNAKTIVKDGIVTIEQEMYFEKQASPNVPVAFILQEKMQNESRLNADEQFKRMVVNYQVDGSDLNTFDDTEKSLFELSSDVINSPDRALELIKGYYQIDVPFARATPKGKLNFIEKTAEVLAKAIDIFTGGNLAQQVADRKQVMQVSSQYFGTTKIAWMNGTKISTQQPTYLSAEYLANTYHYSRFITYNQKDVYENMPCAMTEDEMFSVLSNNFVILTDGRVAEVTRLTWSDYTHLGEISFKVRKPSINVANRIVND